MKCKFLLTSEIKDRLCHLMDKYEAFHWAVAWGSDGEMADRLLQHEVKISQVIFGTHFCQTDPRLLERLQSSGNVCIVPQAGNGTFHPKVFGFVSGNYGAAIVGSANFTNAGVGGNVEAAIYLEGQTNEEPIAQVLSFVDELWETWKAKGRITNDFLNAYRRQYEANRHLRLQLGNPPRIPQGRTQQAEYNLLEMDWVKYQTAITEAVDESTVRARLDLLGRANDLLNGRRFEELGGLERRAIAGLATRKQIEGTPVDNVDWAWFGSMLGAGGFQNRINENDSHISTALGLIPSRGAVTRENFEGYRQEFLRGFVNSKRKPDVATATRLLAMKRPDYFVCVDSENERGLGAGLGFAYSTLKLDQYWDLVVEPITQTSWWRVNEPQGQAGLLWQARAAMLDVLYYKG